MKKILAGFMALLLLCSLFGCNKTAPEPTTTATTQATTVPTTAAPTEPPITEPYTLAAAAVRDAKDLKIELTTKKDIVALNGSFSSVSEQELILTGIGTEDFAAAMTEDFEMGGLLEKITEYFTDDVLYLNMMDSAFFQGKMSAQDYMARFAPAALLDETLYADVAVQESDHSVTLTFSQPIGPEEWALPQGAEFLTASGSAKITDKGTLARTVYTVEYITGSSIVSMEVTAEAEIYDDDAPEAPQNPYQYNEVESIEAVRLLDFATMYISSTEAASSMIFDTIMSQAAGGMLMTQTEIHFTGSEENLLAFAESTYSAYDGSGASDPFTMTESFRDGKYSRTLGDEDDTPDYTIDAKSMRKYMLAYCMENVVPVEYVDTAKIENLNGLICLEFGLNADWGKHMAAYLSYQLFEDEDLLDNEATDYKTTTALYCMTLDPLTGIPVAISTSYEGVHTIEGQECLLSQEIAQSLRLVDSSTYTDLTDENAPEDAPENKATPLLYKVTGKDGQEMYLMGTIHVGDVKTGFLPQEVYDAFDASDALAVEVDVIAFEEKMENDPELSEQVANYYVNPEGKSTKDLLSEETYEKALKLLKATGSYSETLEYMRPYTWSSVIEDLYMMLGALRPEKGMDMRLLMMAKEQDKKVLEVEETMSHYEMYTNFSQELQEYLLADTVNANAIEYCQSVQELYDLWCEGDEAALRQMLSEESGEMTEEEQALYQEYMDAMIIRRNENMLDVAISYLESGETVFYAVGLAHLLQENGLVDTLREAGYTVEQVIYQ